MDSQKKPITQSSSIVSPKQDERDQPLQDVRASDPVKPRRIEPPPCSRCTAIRPEGTNYSLIYAKRGRKRYVKCRYCGNTWKIVEP